MLFRHAVVTRMHSYFSMMFYYNVCLKGPHGQLIRVLVSECDDFEYCDPTVDFE